MACCPNDCRLTRCGPIRYARRRRKTAIGSASGSAASESESERGWQRWSCCSSSRHSTKQRSQRRRPPPLRPARPSPKRRSVAHRADADAAPSPHRRPRSPRWLRSPRSPRSPRSLPRWAVPPPRLGPPLRTHNRTSRWQLAAASRHARARRLQPWLRTRSGLRGCTSSSAREPRHCVAALRAHEGAGTREGTRGGTLRDGAAQQRPSSSSSARAAAPE